MAAVTAADIVYALLTADAELAPLVALVSLLYARRRRYAR